MDILGLTSFDQIRGVLAVSPRDINDQTLAAYDLPTDLEVDLDGWLEDWGLVLTADERPAKLLRLYAKYKCAAWVAASGQNFMFTQMTDGANAAQRSDTEGFQELRSHLEARSAHYQTLIAEELMPASSAAVRPIFGRSIPTRDPVTESRS